jgi:Tfp pilus assembly protein FimT
MTAHIDRRGKARSDAGFTAIEVLTTAAFVCVLAALATPLMGNMLGAYRLSGDARGLSNSVAVAKMRAASLFSQTRVYVDLGARTYRIETWIKTGTPGWAPDGASSTTSPGQGVGQTGLSSGVNFGFGSVAAAPTNTQGTIGQAPLCREDDNTTTIAGTACIIFNSRGLPVDGAGQPTGSDAVYLNDGQAVFGVTIGATGIIRLWRTPQHTSPTWSLQ